MEAKDAAERAQATGHATRLQSIPLPTNPKALASLLQDFVGRLGVGGNRQMLIGGEEVTVGQWVVVRLADPIIWDYLQYALLGASGAFALGFAIGALWLICDAAAQWLRRKIAQRKCA